MNGAAAEAIAIHALSFLANDPKLLDRFLRMTGIEVDSIRAATSQPGFFAGLLDFLIAHEPTLLEFTAAADLLPEDVLAARHALGGQWDSVSD